jgi:uncharacterized coiled-coil protein SlyX
MQPQPLERRVERLEARVTILEELPARVDALTLQVSQLREEMRAEFSAVRDEISGLRGEVQAGLSELRDSLHEKLRAVVDEIMGQTRSLYEDVISRIALIEEGQRHPRSRKQVSEAGRARQRTKRR